MYTVKAKPVFSVPVSTGIASSAAAASENGVSLFRVKVRSRQLTAGVDSKDTAMIGYTPCEPTVSRRWEDSLIRASRVLVV